MRLSKLVKEELEHKRGVACDETALCKDTPDDVAHWQSIADSIDRVLDADSIETLRVETLAVGELQNLIDIATDNLQSGAGDEARELRRYVRNLKAAIGE